MTFEEAALELARELLRKSGVREWDDTSTRQRMMIAAVEMAAAIFGEADMTTNAVYVKHGSPIIFGSEVGDDVAWSTENIANGAGRQASLYDQGLPTTPRPLTWEYSIYTQAQATPTVNNILDCRLKTGDGTHYDNDDGTTDAAVSSVNQLLNLKPLNSPCCTVAAANREYRSEGRIQISQRYFGPVLWNLFGSALTNDAAETKAVFTPLYEDIQAAA